MYTPLPIDAKPNIDYHTSPMARGGLNLEALPEMMSLEYAKKIINYIPFTHGAAVRKGLERVADRGITEGATLFKYFRENVFIIGYGTTVEAYNMSTGTFTVIKNDFSANDKFGGNRYGEYFFVTNGVDKPHRIDKDLNIVEVVNAPICDDMVFIAARAVAISLSTDETAVQISEIDDASNPPFATWSTGTSATDGGVVNYRNAGKARSCVPLGRAFVVFSDEGYFAFSVEQLDSAGTLKKFEMVQDYIQDYGGARGAITTPSGVFYLNEAGLWQLVQVGQTDVPYSRQQKLSTVLLTDHYFKDVDFTNVDLTYDDVRKLVLVAYAQGSDVNNKVLGYKTSEKVEAVFEIEGWAINRFAKLGDYLYACSSNSGKIYECFKGWTDDGLPIGVEYAQEIPMKGLFAKRSMHEFYAKGFLSADTEIDVHMDIYDTEGAPFESKRINKWTAQRNDNTSDGWGTASWGKSAWGGDYDLSGMIESFDGCKPRINNFQRMSVRFSASVKEPHIINWFSAKIRDKAPIRRRLMEKIT